MVRLDIIAGLKNGVERGYSLEQSKQSLINAGYSINEINEAVNYITGGISLREIIPQETKTNTKTNFNQNPNQNPNQTSQISQSPQEETKQNLFENTNYKKALDKSTSKFPWKILLLTGFLFFLILLLILVIIFRENIISFLDSIFSA